MKSFDRKTQKRVAWLLVAAIMLFYIIYLSYIVLLRYYTFKATAFDLGNMDQVLWNTIHGRPFQFTNQGSDWYGPPTRLAIHFEPIILPLSLLYLLPREPQVLLVFQTLALASGALPVFLLTRRQIPEMPLFAPVMAAAYLATPSYLALNLFDFHPVSLATPLLLYAILALAYRRFGWSMLAFVLAASCKEDVPLAIACVGLLLVWRYKMPRIGTTLLLGGFFWSALAFLVIIPHFFPGAQHNNYWYRYQELGSTPGTALLNVLLHPWLLLTTFVTLDRIYYLAGLVRSSGFLALLSPEWLIPTLPSLAVNLYSNYPFYYSGVYQYNAAIVPFVVIAAIEGSRRVVNLWHAWRNEPVYSGDLLSPSEPVEARTIVTAPMPAPTVVKAGPPAHLQGLQGGRALVLARVNDIQAFLLQCVQSTRLTLARSSTLLQPAIASLSQLRERQWSRFSARMIPLARGTTPLCLQITLCAWVIAMAALNLFILSSELNIFWPDHQPGPREQHIEQLLAMIPPDASVSASTTLNPHLSQRLYITLFPTITFATSEKSINNTVQYIVVDLNSLFPEDRVSTTNEINQLVASRQFRILARAEGVILLIRVT